MAFDYKAYERSPKRREWKRAYDRKRSKTPKRAAWRKTYMRAWGLRTRYGLTLPDYNRILAEQGGVCKSCKEPAPVYKRSSCLSVDHDHVTGEVRGLLCQPCNHMVGWVEKHKHRLELAEAYLRAR